MKIFRLKRNPLNIQKCLLPECKFLKEYHGRYCIIKDNDRQYIVKIGLCEVKSINGAIFLDDSVFKYSSFENINKTSSLTTVNFEDFVVLNKPKITSAIRVLIVFNDVFDVKKYQRNKKCLQEIVRNILKFFVISDKCVVLLQNFSKLQNFNIHCLIVSVDDPDKIYKVSSDTQILIEKCISKLKFDQLQELDNRLQFGGCSKVYEILKETIEFAKCFDNHNLKLVKKLLLIGPPGCGKTTLVHKVVKDCKCVLLETSAGEINSLTTGATERKLSDLFKEAKIYAENEECCVILIEDINLMTVGKSLHSKQLVRHLIALLEDVENIPGIVVISTTNNPEEVDIQLRMPQRLEDELEILTPTSEEREEIITSILQQCKVHVNDDLIHQLAKWTPGFVGADLKLVIIEALLAANKIQDSKTLSEHCLKKALTKVIPSSLRGTAELCRSKDVSFSQIGGLDKIKQILDLSLKQQLEKPEKFLKLGIPLTKGILLYGPPGCAKTTLVKALAKECNATFLATSAADLYSPFVGDSEKKLVQLFNQARIGSPSILFIDEIDAVVGSKSGTRERGVQERILSTLLIEMDGVGLKVNTQKDNSLWNLENGEFPTQENAINSGVIVIGATNCPQLLDDALKRPGRFDRLLYVPPPDCLERLKILQKLTEKMSLDAGVDLVRLAEITNYFSGADLKNLCQESGLFALTSTQMNAERISQCHFEHVLKEYKPSLNDKVVGFYESFEKHNT